MKRQLYSEKILRGMRILPVKNMDVGAAALRRKGLLQ